MAGTDSSTGSFLNADSLSAGPWQAFERLIARLMLARGFRDVRLVGGSGDLGADVLGTHEGVRWVVQCKFSQSGSISPRAFDEVIRAAETYGCERMLLAISCLAPVALRDAHRDYQRRGYGVDLLDADELLRLANDTLEYPPARRKLYDYQIEAVRLLDEALAETRRGQLVLATGLGKTVVLAQLVANLFSRQRLMPPRVYVVAHTRDLVDQLHRSFWHQLPRWIPTHRFVSGDRPVSWDGLEGVVFATVQTLAAQVDEVPPCGLLVIDEAHHLGADSFRELIRTMGPPLIVGATATPWRGDGFDISELLGPPVLSYGIEDGLARGFLSEIDYRIHADNVDWEMIQALSENRYSLPQLNRRLLIPTRDERAVQIICRIFEDQKVKRGIVYSPSLAHAHSFRALLRQYDFSSECVSGEMSARDREAALSRFSAGEVEFVTSVDLLNEGVDVPDVDIVVFMRATHSRRIFVQQLGRGLRVSPGKAKVVVLDFVSDLKRVRDVVDLDRAVRGAQVESLGLGPNLIDFANRTTGDFMREWVMDQASLKSRVGSSNLELPPFQFPDTNPYGNVQ